MLNKSLYLLIFLSTVTIQAQISLEQAIKEYEAASQSCNIKRYNDACTLLKKSLKKATPTELETCKEVVLKNKPKNSRANRIIAATASVLSTNPIAIINTIIQGRSARNDNTKCRIATVAAVNGLILTSALKIGRARSLEVNALTEGSAAEMGALMADCSGHASNNAQRAINDRMASYKDNTLKSLAVNIYHTVSVLFQGTALYFNAQANNEKMAFDDAHQSLIRHLDMLTSTKIKKQ